MITLLRYIQHKTDHYSFVLQDQAERVKAARVACSTHALRFLLGERKMTAAALIETPQCIQPDQRYVVRNHLLGRDEPTAGAGIDKVEPSAGLSALVRGELVHIEVRAAISQDDLSVVQKAEVCLPGSDYLAQVTLPLQPRSRCQRGQRERVHIVFMDKMHRPLYERPFVIDLFISPLVRTGREGYHALSIPF